MICAVITGPCLSDIQRQLKEAYPIAGLFEFRIDLWEHLNDLHLFESMFDRVILTCRKKEDGGAFGGSEAQRLNILRKYLRMNPAYIDLELGFPDKVYKEFKKLAPSTKVIRSLHLLNFLEPKRIKSLLKAKGDLHKLAFPFKTFDHFLAIRDKYPEIQLLMGVGKGAECTRILGPYLGSHWIYAPVCKATIQGQITLEDIINIYGGLNLERIYGLIGNPLDKSLGYQFHNMFFRQNAWNYGYVNFPLVEEEIEHFFSYLKSQTLIKGLSVTSPLKEAVLPFLDHLSEDAKRMGAVNTIIIKEGVYYGDNTDGLGAIKILPDLHQKKVTILGAGGTAKAIALKAKDSGAIVTLLNRTPKKLERFSNLYNFEIGNLSEVNSCDVLINATKVSSPIDKLPNCSLVFDVNYGETDLIKRAKHASIEVLTGEQLFFSQAKQQQLLWFEKAFQCLSM